MDAARLRRDADIAAVWGSGMKLHHPLFAVRALSNETGVARVAVSAPRAVGRSVKRNRARRRVREAFRSAIRATDASSGCDLVIVARAPAAAAPFADLRAAATATMASIARRPVPAP